ncbi:MAG: peptidoglycan glycosyltransferase [Opitutaceae bacterium]|jgi:penicillin-binding protein 2|nr:peptidoglycan glycosyltransferase [Opitutaceae bacterium]
MSLPFPRPRPRDMDHPLEARSGKLTEMHKGYDPRILIFYPIVAALLLLILGGFAYQQLFKADIYHERERLQHQRRILLPAPRGNIYDREGRLLVGNRARFEVTLNLDELRREFRLEYLRIRKNYRELGDKDIPSASQMAVIARYSVVQRHLDEVNRIIGREARANSRDLERHFRQQLLLPYTLLDDLTPGDYARLAEQLPVRSPLQLTATSVRDYPHGSAASHILGYTGATDDTPVEGFPGEDLATFKMRGTTGRAGIEKRFNEHLQGKAGGAIYRVDPAGYRIDPPLMRRTPVQGRNLTLSLDLDLQLAAEAAMEDLTDDDGTRIAGAAVAIDVRTGEVLALASKPDYDLNHFTPRLTPATFKEIEDEGGWLNRATQSFRPPGSTFKILTAIAAFRAGALEPDTEIACHGALRIGDRLFHCHNHRDRGPIAFPDAIAKSCNIFFYTEGLATGQPALAETARLFGLDQRTGIEIDEGRRMNVPDPAWKKNTHGESWTAGDTAQMAIGQSGLLCSPLQMACLAASIARGEVRTPPTILHDPARPRLRTGQTGLTPAQQAALLEGMKRTVKTGTGRRLNSPAIYPEFQNLEIAAKTGTAQMANPRGGGKYLNIAWFIGFAPAENPQIAIAVAMDGHIPGEEFGGGAIAAPIAGQILKTWAAKRTPRQPE